MRNCDGVCEGCDGAGEVILKCCAEGDPCPYTGAIGVCEMCDGDGKCRCDDCSTRPSAAESEE